VFASPLESVNDVDSLALQETARPQTVPQTRFGGRIYSETGHFPGSSALGRGQSS